MGLAQGHTQGAAMGEVLRRRANNRLGRGVEMRIIYPYWGHGLTFGQLLGSIMTGAAKAVKAKPIKSADYYRQNGPQECARRRRQIERGILKIN